MAPSAPDLFLHACLPLPLCTGDSQSHTVQAIGILCIQVQKLKVDTEAAMLEIDQILKANELSISLVSTPLDTD